jgi:serine/threonine protein kinase
MKWIAPEVITNKEYTTKSHIWSFGILLYELITYGSNPYPHFSDDQILQLILDGYRMYKVNSLCLLMMIGVLFSQMIVVKNIIK